MGSGGALGTWVRGILWKWEWACRSVVGVASAVWAVLAPGKHGSHGSVCALWAAALGTVLEYHVWASFCLHLVLARCRALCVTPDRSSPTAPTASHTGLHRASSVKVGTVSVSE